MAVDYGVMDGIMQRHGTGESAVIAILQEVQEHYRYLPAKAMAVTAQELGVPAAKIYGVATFYAHFALEPKGKHVIRVCDGTACHVKGSTKIINALYDRLGVNAEKKTSKDMLFTVETVSCLGACGLAPVMLVDEDVYGQVKPEKALAIVEDIYKAAKA